MAGTVAGVTGRNSHADVDLFLRLDQIGAVLGALLVIVINAGFLRNAGVWLVLPPMAVLYLGLIVARRSLRQGRLLQALIYTAVANWIIAICIPILLPFLWPVMTITVLMPLVLAIPYLTRSQVLPAIIGTALAAAVVAAIGLLNDDGGAIQDIDDAVELIVVAGSVVAQIVPIGMVAWLHNQMQRSNADSLQLLNDELQLSEKALAASRDRVVRAADTERRRIERDLHDGAQQRLVALGVRLRLLRSQDQEQPPTTEAIDTLIEELDGAISEVRELAHGIYPPLLQTRGLPDALSAVVRRSALDVETSIDELDRFDVPVETALYFTALEALTNAAKHAPDASVQLLLDLSGDQLVLEVRDDGPGFDINLAAQSHGFHNMEDRLAVVGGNLEISSAPDKGTRIVASVPARPATTEL